MLKNKKLIAILVVILVGGGAAYSMAAPKPLVVKKIKGTVYVLPQPFLLNLNDGHYAKLSLGLILAPGQSDGASAEGGSSGGSESAGTLPEEAVIRDIVTNLLTNSSSGELMSDGGRHDVKRQIVDAIKQQTDVKVEAVLFPELTVQ
jgi:flagellar basal body-associated protein FliL